MTDSDHIEEILIEAYAHNMRDEVINWANKEMKENPKLSKVDAYEIAFREWCK